MNTKIQGLGYLVMIGKIPHVVTPTTPVVVKQKVKQFWFYLNGKPLLARQAANGWYV